MKKILTIDFDIIMYPCEQLYHNLVPHKTWKELEINPLFSLVYGDLDLYKKLTQLLLNHTKILSNEDFYFITNHEDIIKILPKTEEFILTNIDQHHDLAYNSPDEQNKITNLGCANWVKYCFDNNYPIKKYHWITSNTAEFPSNFLIQKYNIELNNINTFNINNIICDKIIICLSPFWIPNNYQQLFFNWINILNYIYNTNFILK